jgi:hypothetical protein
MKNYLYQLLNEHGFKDVSHAEIYMREPLLPGKNPSEVEITTEGLKRYIYPCIYQVSENLNQSRGNIFVLYVLRSTVSLIVFRIRKNSHSSGETLLLYLFIKRAIKHCNSYI